MLGYFHDDHWIKDMIEKKDEIIQDIVENGPLADSVGESGIVKDVLDGLNEDDISEKYGSNVEEKSDWLDGSIDLGDTSEVFIYILDD